MRLSGRGDADELFVWEQIPKVSRGGGLIGIGCYQIGRVITVLIGITNEADGQIHIALFLGSFRMSFSASLALCELLDEVSKLALNTGALQRLPIQPMTDQFLWIGSIGG